MFYEEEVWMPSPSLPAVVVSSHGRVMVKPYLAPLARGGTRSYGGHPNLGQWDGNRYIYVLKQKSYKVHRLVCEAFNGPCPPGLGCLHIDENARNNRPDNLKWGTQKENLNAPGYLEYCRSRIGDENPYIKGRYRSPEKPFVLNLSKHRKHYL